MKKTINLTIIFILLSILISLPLPAFAVANSCDCFHDTNTRPLEGSKEELYQDIFVTLLDPCISKAIKNYYGKDYSHAPYDTDILSAERPNGYRSFVFLIKLQVMPYVGAHNTIGVDNLTIKVSGEGCKVEKFQHIKSYPIPSWLE